ncbi:MAG: hypothetical protein ACO2XQ_09620, partial [Flavobacteriales bacterium]
VTVTSTGGTLALNGAGQTVDLDATTLDVDAGTITVDATTTTFTGDVKGPKSTGDDEFVTYWQLDSLANQAPFLEMIKRFQLSSGDVQTFTAGAAAANLDITGASNLLLDIYQEESDAVTNAPVGDQPLTTNTLPNYHINCKDAGVYEAKFTCEVSNSAAADALVTASLMNYDANETFYGTTRTLASDTEIVYGTGNATFTGVNMHLNLSMVFETDNDDEDIYINIATVGANVDVETFSIAVSRVGE